MCGKRAGRGAGKGWARWLAAAMACAVLGGCFSGGPGKIRFEEPETTPLVLDSAPASIELVGGEETQISLPRPSGGTKPYTYALKCGNVDEGDGLPTGVELDPRTGRLSGIPEDAPYSKACTYTVSDGALFGRQSKRLELWVSVRPGALFLPSVGGPTGLQVGRMMTPYPLPAAQGGKAPYFYAISCERESVVKKTDKDGNVTEEKLTLAISLAGIGLELSGKDGLEAGVQPELSGTPTASGIISCTYEVSTRGAQIKRVKKPLVMEIAPAAPSSALSLTPGSIDLGRLAHGSAIEPRALPRASGGVPPYMYDLKCAGEQVKGLRVDPSGPVEANVEPVLTGRPEVARGGNYRCTLTVTDSTKPNGEIATATVSFVIEEGWTFGSGPFESRKGACGTTAAIPSTGLTLPTAVKTSRVTGPEPVYAGFKKPAATAEWKVTTNTSGPPTINVGSNAVEGQIMAHVVANDEDNATLTNADDAVCAFARTRTCTVNTESQWVIWIEKADWSSSAGWSCTAPTSAPLLFRT